MIETLQDRIAKRLEALEISPRAASLHSGLSADFIRSLMGARTKSPSVENLTKLALGLECSPEWLAFGSTDQPARPSVFVPVLGQVAAGAWHEVDDGVDEPRSNRRLVADPRFPADAQFGLTAIGESMNLLFSDQDDLLCLDFHQVPDGPKPGHDDIVIVEQLRDGGSLREVSAKQLKLTTQGPILEARSTHPKWVDFRLRPTSAGEADMPEVLIKALVLRSERQWWAG